MKIEVVGVQATKRESQTERRGVADGDMLIYELQGFALTTPSFTETERKVGGKIARKQKQERRDRHRDTKVILTGRCRDGARELKFGGGHFTDPVIPLLFFCFHTHVSHVTLVTFASHHDHTLDTVAY